MTIWEQLDRDHIVIHASGAEIFKSDGDLPRRDNLFTIYDREVRDHLSIVETVIFPLLKSDEASKEIAATLETEHKALRKALSKLHRKDKSGTEWIADLTEFTTAFERTCRQHDGLESLTRSTIDDARAEQLGADYAAAKDKQANRGLWNWKKAGVVGTAVGIAAVGAAAAVRARRAGASEEALRLETDESLRLISSKKVEGTAVVGADGEKIGTVESFMVDKYTGRVAYAVLSFGGLMGVGRSLFPLPWSILDYDVDKDGYALDISKEQLAKAPRYEAGSEPEFDLDYRRDLGAFYAAPVLMAV